MLPNFQILNSPELVSPYVDQVIEMADQNKTALGFFPSTAFRQQASSGRLWIITLERSGEVAGYLLFGGRHPKLKIVQLFVHAAHRNQSLATVLLSALAKWGEKHSYTTITARVAADLPSNRFWDKLGLKLLRQVDGGKTTKRLINLRARELSTPTLLDFMDPIQSIPVIESQDMHFRARPVVNTPVYCLDLNVFFDIVKNRKRSSDAAKLIQLGFTQNLSLTISPEFINELERNASVSRSDPVIEFAKTLPILPEIPDSEIDTYFNQLKYIVFPNIEQSGRKLIRSTSDIIHLIYGIHHGVNGFVTQDRAVLRASDQINEKFGMEILSPVDLTISYDFSKQSIIPIDAKLGDETLILAKMNEADRGMAEKFLNAYCDSQQNIMSILNPGVSHSLRNRLCAKKGESIVAIGTWDPPNKNGKQNVLNLIVNESTKDIEAVIDHILETALRSTNPFSFNWLKLNTPIDSSITRTTASKRGFTKLHKSNSTELQKLIFAGYVSAESWNDFRNDFENFTQLSLPSNLPTFAEFENTGVIVKNNLDKTSKRLNLFNFETLISPGFMLCPKRPAIMVPIRIEFAKDLFAYAQDQLELFTSPEAMLRVEKTYFRNASGADRVCKGALVYFYLSGSGGGSMEVIGCGRVTFSKIMAVDQIGFLFKRQGVLPDKDLRRIANSKGYLHVFTFDNFNPFSRRIPFEYLKNNRIISKANLITTEQITAKNSMKLCDLGFKIGEKQ